MISDRHDAPFVLKEVDRGDYRHLMHTQYVCVYIYIYIYGRAPSFRTHLGHKNLYTPCVWP